MSSYNAKAINSKVQFFYKYGIYILFLLLVSLFAVMSPTFRTLDNVVYILLTTAPYGIAVVGMTFVIITAGLDLSVGAIVLASCGTTVLCGNAGWGILPTLVVAILVGFVIGAINGLVISKWNLVPFITTLATMMWVRGTILTFTNGGILVQNNPNFLNAIAGSRLFGVPAVVYVFVLIAIIGQLILSKTRFGWHVYAMGHNEGAARNIGIKVVRNKWLVYTICGTLTGLSGFMQSSIAGAVNPTFGQGQEFTIISATVLGGVSLFGGKGRILPGAVMGILIFTIIENAMALMSANPYFYTMVRGVVIFLAVMLDCIGNKGELR